MVHLRRILIFLIGFTVLVGCAAPAPHHTPSPAPTTSATPTGSVTLPPGHDLFTPGLAQQVVADLTAAAHWRPVVRVTLDRTQARLTYIDTANRPHSVRWSAGQISPSDDGTDLVEAASFNPAAFNLGDVAVLFEQAAEVAGSAARQELQITEYDHGQVLMTITTSPESSTVFFDATGTLIPRLDYTQDTDIATALADVTAGRLLVLAVGVDGEHRLWADVVASSGVIERRFRPANVPMYLAQRRETSDLQQFDHAQIDPRVLGLLLRTAPGLLGQPATASVTLLIHRRPGDTGPRITTTVNGASLVTDVNGVPIAEP